MNAFGGRKFTVSRVIGEDETDDFAFARLDGHEQQGIARPAIRIVAIAEIAIIDLFEMAQHLLFAADQKGLAAAILFAQERAEIAQIEGEFLDLPEFDAIVAGDRLGFELSTLLADENERDQIEFEGEFDGPDHLFQQLVEAEVEFEDIAVDKDLFQPAIAAFDGREAVIVFDHHG